VTAASLAWLLDTGIALFAFPLPSYAIFFPVRAYAVLAAATVLLLPSRLRPTAWWLAAVAAAAGALSLWAAYRPLSTGLATGLALATAMSIPGALLARWPERSSWLTAGIAGLCASVLLALTGSVRLATECLLISLPMLALTGRPMGTDGARAVGLLLGLAVGCGVIFSELGLLALVPLLCLLAAPLGGWRGPLLATAIAAAGIAPVAVSWLREPPF
jgi:hypothetical protein